MNPVFMRVCATVRYRSDFNDALDSFEASNPKEKPKNNGKQFIYDRLKTVNNPPVKYEKQFEALEKFGKAIIEMDNFVFSDRAYSYNSFSAEADEIIRKYNNAYEEYKFELNKVEK